MEHCSSLVTAVNAWSVDGPDLNSADLAANIFASSLFPYLALLFFLSRPETRTPKLGNFGFQFLLVFVFATIPAGIYAKIAYQDTLANVDWLHGIAESFLTVTNLLIISGFRQTRVKAPSENVAKTFSDSFLLLVPAVIVLSSYLLPAFSGVLGDVHAEPDNALSIPTWVVHTSSLLEWLVAMKLIWEHAETSGNHRWKGMTWGMIPSHASGLCACTYHLFYNSPALLTLVTLQAALTVLGNTTMAAAAYRIYQYEKDEQLAASGGDIAKPIQPLSDEEMMSLFMSGNNVPLAESDTTFWTNMFLKSTLLALLVKYGELYTDFPFQPTVVLALAFILLPTVANVAKWNIRASDAATTKLEPA
eukprot:CAMPEP_0174961070 /NCGR_PEP_ID=MMETSP0004_2-20121128/4041_1 /TAXON_ID=420556 /ORGANISM="Ochromonas sp., Strain CCMP1393" /LENGTH=361 /DNA_ID=CAMNT_0016209485 /DNA_START=54 /DNA_END=1139 /DNA_ORIENTATION=-